MPESIVKLTDAGVERYLIWSTIVDAPVSDTLTRADVEATYQHQPGFSERMARVEKHGTSCREPTSVEDLVAFNRAGRGEACLTLDQILDHYVRGYPLAKEQLTVND